MSMVIQLNPTGHHQCKYSEIMERIGILPTFLDSKDSRSMKKQMLEGYGFPTGSIDGGTLSEEGVYSHPSDPPLYPYICIRRGCEKVYIYDYGIVAFVEPECATYITRMD